LKTTDSNIDRHPRVAVLINNFNNGPWIQACVESVIHQTRRPDEIIVYDDGSTDDSLPILRSFGAKISLIEGVHNDSIIGIESQARAVNAAFEASSADHLYLLDGDDVFLPEKIARYESAWSKCPEAPMVQASTRLIDFEGNTQRDGYEALKHPSHGDYLAATYRTQDTDLYYSTSALAFSRSFLEHSLPLNYSDGISLAVDSRLGSIAPLHGQVITLKDSLTLWRQHDRSQSRQDDQRVPLAGTLRRHQYFNAYARRQNHRPIKLWLNLRFYRQFARRILPNWLASPFAKNKAGLRS
jgi:glycosyltransferase involved in cell wall biosynthesis